MTFYQLVHLQGVLLHNSRTKKKSNQRKYTCTTKVFINLSCFRDGYPEPVKMQGEKHCLLSCHFYTFEVQMV